MNNKNSEMDSANTLPTNVKTVIANDKKQSATGNMVPTSEVPKRHSKASHNVIKYFTVGGILLLMLIPLIMVKSLINERKNNLKEVEFEVMSTVGGNVEIDGPSLIAVMPGKVVESDKKNDNIEGVKTEARRLLHIVSMDYQVNTTTDKLHRSIYHVLIYNSDIEIAGKFVFNGGLADIEHYEVVVGISSLKGLIGTPCLTLGDKSFDFTRNNNQLVANVKLPENVKEGDEVPYTMSFRLQGTGEIRFIPKADITTLKMTSEYPHPAFCGDILPTARDLRDDGFTAEWSVSKINLNTPNDYMGVRFVEPANPYQQATRSAKYGLLIIVLVFVAGLLVEQLTGREINPIQYAVMGLSLVLFYSLLLSFSEIIIFWAAYLIAAAMTTFALVFYFRAILKHRSAYVLGIFVALVYVMNFILLQMEKFALLSGSLILFALLSMIMYITANINSPAKTE